MNTAPGYPPLAAEYRVRATRYSRGWEFYISDAEHGEIGVTCAPQLASAGAMVRDYLAAVHGLTDAQTAALAVTVVPDLDDETTARILDARRLAEVAEAARDAAAAASREAVAYMDEHGFSGREIATILDLSPQRVSQLLAA